MLVIPTSFLIYFNKFHEKIYKIKLIKLIYQRCLIKLFIRAIIIIHSPLYLTWLQFSGRQEDRVIYISLVWHVMLECFWEGFPYYEHLIFPKYFQFASSYVIVLQPLGAQITKQLTNFP